MRLFGLIGYPLSHSFSQKYFSEKFLREEIKDCSYHNFPIAQIDELVEIFKNNPSLSGLNITIPYKEQVIKYLDDITDIVKETGACNCIKIQNGKRTGYNTDVIGFEKSFSELLKPWHTQALVLGTGGASKAVQYSLRRLGIPFRIVSRKPKQGETGYDELTPQIMEDYPVIINTTPLGMQPDIDSSPSLPYLSLSEKHYLFDLVYNPPETKFLSEGKKRGAIVKNGYDMLIYQAEESWSIWNR